MVEVFERPFEKERPACTWNTLVSSTWLAQRCLVQVKLCGQCSPEQYVIEMVDRPFKCNDVVQAPTDDQFEELRIMKVYFVQTFLSCCTCRGRHKVAHCFWPAVEGRDSELTRCDALRTITATWWPLTPNSDGPCKNQYLFRVILPSAQTQWSFY